MQIFCSHCSDSFASPGRAYRHLKIDHGLTHDEAFATVGDMMSGVAAAAAGFAQAKQQPRAVLKALGVQAKSIKGKAWRGPCPVHGGSHATFAVDLERGGYHCFKCGAKGNMVDLWSLLRNVEPHTAASQIGQHFRPKP